MGYLIKSTIYEKSRDHPKLCSEEARFIFQFLEKVSNITNIWLPLQGMYFELLVEAVCSVTLSLFSLFWYLLLS